MISNYDRTKIVIKLGGSLISVKDGTLDTEFIGKFAAFIRELSKSIPAIFIVVGGGKVVRNYQDVARELGVKNGDDLDVIGMRLTRVNAELMRAAIGRDIAGEIIYTGGEFRWFSPVIIGAGWGHAVTSDYNAVSSVDWVGCKELIRLSNIDYIYTDDPKKNPQAKAIKSLNWSELEGINKEEGNDQFRPGMHVPMDPRAAALASRMQLKMAFIHGHNIEEIKKYLQGEDFIGTLVE